MRNRTVNGFTLLETLIALAIFAIISVGVLMIWQYSLRNSLQLFAGTDAFENARAAMDALLINIQLADELTLETDSRGMLKRLTLSELDQEKSPHDYIFYYDAGANTGETKYHRLEFGLNDEFASQIGEIRLKKKGDLIHITVSTDGEATESITLQSVAEIKNKKFSGIELP